MEGGVGRGQGRGEGALEWQPGPRDPSALWSRNLPESAGRVDDLI